MSFFNFGRKAEHDLDAQEFKAAYKKDPKAVVLDVRTQAEFADGAIDNAVNIDFFDASFRTKISQLPKDKVYYVYCRSGNRSGQAVKFMKANGFSAYNLAGGIMAYTF